MNADCYYGDHEWRGGVCVGCGERLRCVCGEFVSIATLEAHHTKRCRWIARRLAATSPQGTTPEEGSEDAR